MTPLETLLLSALTGLGGVVGLLWRTLEKSRAECRDDQRKSTRLLMALMQRLSELDGRNTPKTPRELASWDIDESTAVTRAGYAHAQKAASEVLENEDIGRLVKEYLANGR